MNINGIDKVIGSTVFHAGTLQHENKLKTNGGRVMAVTSLASNISDAVAISLENAAKIDFDGKYYRKDIGKDLLL